MTDLTNNTQTILQAHQPDVAFKCLEALIGKWDLKGRTFDATEDNITGWNTFEWILGGFFLKSIGEINFNGVKFQSLEIIAYDPTMNIFPSIVYSSISGEVLQYYWDMQGNIILHANASSIYTGILSIDGKTLSGGWRPREGEQQTSENTYDAVMTRMQ